MCRRYDGKKKGSYSKFTRERVQKQNIREKVFPLLVLPINNNTYLEKLH